MWATAYDWSNQDTSMKQKACNNRMQEIRCCNKGRENSNSRLAIPEQEHLCGHSIYLEKSVQTWAQVNIQRYELCSLVLLVQGDWKVGGLVQGWGNPVTKRD